MHFRFLVVLGCRRSFLHRIVCTRLLCQADTVKAQVIGVFDTATRMLGASSFKVFCVICLRRLLCRSEVCSEQIRFLWSRDFNLNTRLPAHPGVPANSFFRPSWKTKGLCGCMQSMRKRQPISPGIVYRWGTWLTTGLQFVRLPSE